MAKLGVSYSFFDGEEILPYSIKIIRPLVDFIVIVNQEVSNFGNPISEKAKEVLQQLRRDKLVDVIIKFNPSLGTAPFINETNKRNLGLDLCRRQKCTHYICMDADELFIPKQFKLAKDDVIARNTDGSFCLFINYYKKPIYQEIDNRPMSSKKGRTSLPFIFKIKETTKHTHNIYAKYDLDVLIDPTRQIAPIKSARKFSSEQLLMHHMSWVRNDITSKVMNSTCRANPAFFEQGKKIIKLYPSWTPGKKIPMFPKKIKVVNNIFGIKL